MRRIEILSECRYFTGIQYQRCGAGIEYASVRDASGPGMARWPCLHLSGRPAAETSCEFRSLLTEQEIAAREAEHAAAVKRAFELLAEGKCHVCGAVITETKVIGRCLYAACGHRLGQRA